jgi:hypothetical protein
MYQLNINDFKPEKEISETHLQILYEKCFVSCRYTVMNEKLQNPEKAARISVQMGHQTLHVFSNCHKKRSF